MKNPPIDHLFMNLVAADVRRLTSQPNVFQEFGNEGPEGTAERLHLQSVSRPFGTRMLRTTLPALKRRIVELSLRDKLFPPLGRAATKETKP
jgi:hypothetical protein